MRKREGVKQEEEKWWQVLPQKVQEEEALRQKAEEAHKKQEAAMNASAMLLAKTTTEQEEAARAKALEQQLATAEADAKAALQVLPSSRPVSGHTQARMREYRFGWCAWCSGVRDIGRGSEITGPACLGLGVRPTLRTASSPSLDDMGWGQAWASLVLQDYAPHPTHTFVQGQSKIAAKGGGGG